MEMVPFYAKFPKIAGKETRCAIVMNQPPLPAGEYAFTESYCNDNSCDCRRVFLNVIYEDKIVATIGYGWEDAAFYGKWMGDSSMAKEVKGPNLELGGKQSDLAPHLLKLFKETMLIDKVFIERLKRHYMMFKEAPRVKIKKTFKDAPAAAPQKKIGRNQPCPCGSGKKYKKCCLD